MLKAFRLDGVFSQAPSDVPPIAVDFVAFQLGISRDLLEDAVWRGRPRKKERAFVECTRLDCARPGRPVIVGLARHALPFEPRANTLALAVARPAGRYREPLRCSTERQFEQLAVGRVCKRLSLSSRTCGSSGMA
jgi:hypothetical protein